MLSRGTRLTESELHIKYTSGHFKYLSPQAPSSDGKVPRHVQKPAISTA